MNNIQLSSLNNELKIRIIIIKLHSSPTYNEDQT